MTLSRMAFARRPGPMQEVGGADDLQTDIMRFMAILSLCLVAIFALVQSIPITPTSHTTVPQQVATTLAEKTPTATTAVPQDRSTVTRPTVESPGDSSPEALPQLTRPTPPVPQQIDRVPVAKTTVLEPATAEEMILDTTISTVAATTEPTGFTLRFASDIALTRLVASQQVAVYAIGNAKAQRMSVKNSAVSFWDASTPNSFHEMDAATVPVAVVAALQRTGSTPAKLRWGVTLPNRLKTQLQQLTQSHQGGSLVISAAGDIVLETPQ